MQRPRKHQIDTEACNALRTIVPSSSVIREIEYDYGLDFQVELFNESKSTGKMFYLQLKGTDKDITDDKVSYQLETKHIEYYSSIGEPVLFVVYSTQTSQFWAIWANKLKSIYSAKSLSQKTIKITLDIRNLIDKSFFISLEKSFDSDKTVCSAKIVELKFGSWTNGIKAANLRNNIKEKIIIELENPKKREYLYTKGELVGKYKRLKKQMKYKNVKISTEDFYKETGVSIEQIVNNFANFEISNKKMFEEQTKKTENLKDNLELRAEIWISQFQENLSLLKNELEIQISKKLKDVDLKKFEDAMEDDFNTADAVSAIFEIVRESNSTVKDFSADYAKKILKVLEDLCSVLGIETTKEEEILDEEIEKLIEERQAARKAKNFARADEIRDELLAKGIILKDTREGVQWKKA